MPADVHGTRLGAGHPLAAGYVVRLLLVGLGCWLSLASCVIERPDEEDKDTDEQKAAPEVPPFATPVRVIATYPEDGATSVPVDTPVWVALDQYLDPEHLRINGSVRVRSNGINAGVQAQYKMTSRRVAVRLRRPLEPGIEYQIRLDEDDFVSVSGAPMLDAPRPRFVTGEALMGSEDDRPAPTWDEIDALLEEGCGCHRLDPFPERWFHIPALTYERMVAQPSLQRPETLLVDPYRPYASYLMFKLLADYPDRDGTAMPPAWADDVELERPVRMRALEVEEIARIEEWIAVGAPR